MDRMGAVGKWETRSNEDENRAPWGKKMVQSQWGLGVLTTLNRRGGSRRLPDINYSTNNNRKICMLGGRERTNGERGGRKGKGGRKIKLRIIKHKGQM